MCRRRREAGAWQRRHQPQRRHRARPRAAEVPQASRAAGARRAQVRMTQQGGVQSPNKVQTTSSVMGMPWQHKSSQWQVSASRRCSTALTCPVRGQSGLLSQPAMFRVSTGTNDTCLSTNAVLCAAGRTRAGSTRGTSSRTASSHASTSAPLCSWTSWCGVRPALAI